MALCSESSRAWNARLAPGPNSGALLQSAFSKYTPLCAPTAPYTLGCRITRFVEPLAPSESLINAWDAALHWRR